MLISIVNFQIKELNLADISITIKIIVPRKLDNIIYKFNLFHYYMIISIIYLIPTYVIN